MNSSEKLLKSMIGDQGYETLEKAIFKRGTASVVDPLEYYLPLIVVPRTILSWLIQTVKPMKRGEMKDVKFPGRDDISIHFEKQDVDQYRAEFVQAGKVIHQFEKQSLPAVAGHLMTTGEMYDSFSDGKAKPGDEGYTEDFSERVKAKIEEPKIDVVKEIISMNDIKPATDSESVKWEMSHANVRELTGVIGKLVDALMMKEMSKRKIEDELDKVAEKEVKDTQGKLETSTTPEEKAKSDAKSAKQDSSIIDQGLTPTELHEEGYKPVVGEQGIEEKEVKRDEGKITKQAISETIPEKPNPVPPVTQEVSPPASQTPMTKANQYFRKKAEVLMKPIVKGEMPKGAGQPVKPSMPTPPKGPVPPGNSPAQAAAKQAQSSARGTYTPPKTPGAAMPKNPASAGKVPQANKPAGQVQKSDYFKSKLTKSEKYTATEGELYKSKCPHCNVAEFKKNEEGNPVFNPCACFAVMKRDDEGKPYKFVEVMKKSETGNFELKFHQNADPDAVKVFLLTLKAHLLVKRKFDV